MVLIPYKCRLETCIKYQLSPKGASLKVQLEWRCNLFFFTFDSISLMTTIFVFCLRHVSSVCRKSSFVRSLNKAKSIQRKRFFKKRFHEKKSLQHNKSPKKPFPNVAYIRITLHFNRPAPWWTCLSVSTRVFILWSFKIAVKYNYLPYIKIFYVIKQSRSLMDLAECIH